MAKVITVELLQPTRRFDCPCCGKQTIRDNGKPVANPCQHFLFAFDGGRGDFTDHAESIDTLIDDASDIDVDPSHVDFVESLPANASVYLIETRDHADGPVVRTDGVAFTESIAVSGSIDCSALVAA